MRDATLAPRVRRSVVGMWRVLGILALIWVGFMVIGAVVKALVWVLVIGGVLFVGTAAYTALNKKDDGPKALR